MRILVLSRNASLYSTSRIVLAARARGHLVAVVDPLDFQIVVSRGKPSLVLGTEDVRGVDLVIPRIGASITTYGLAVVRQLDMMRIPVLNSAVAIARSRDKLRAFQLLTRRNIDVPITVCARNPATIAGAVERVGGTPAIVKIQQGTQGIGTMIAETPQAVSSLLETLWAMGQDIVLQEYIRESKGRDVRTIVVGGRVVAKILEINSSPGLEGIERASGIDVAGAIVKHAERFALKRGKRATKKDLDSRIDAVQEDERGRPPARRRRS